MAIRMVTDLIYVRYTGNPEVLKACLKQFFTEDEYPGLTCLVEAPEDEGEKWKVSVPKYLTDGQKAHIQREFRAAYYGNPTASSPPQPTPVPQQIQPYQQMTPHQQMYSQQPYPQHQHPQQQQYHPMAPQPSARSTPLQAYDQQASEMEEFRRWQEQRQRQQSQYPPQQQRYQ